jgi:hypothetical protein
VAAAIDRRLSRPRQPLENVHSGQLDWQVIGCERTAACGADAEMVVNVLPMNGLLEWLGSTG